MILRDALLASLADLPGTRDFHLHVLLSSPRKHSSPFPYAHPRPRTYLQDLFILLSEQAPGSPRVLVTAIEAAVYHVPSTSSLLLYVSKVDSSGHARAPAPTGRLVRALLAFYADPATRPRAADTLWVQLFARAQAQYLFPNSADWPGKRPLAGVQLCAWWQRVLSEVAADVRAPLAGNEAARVRLCYLLPGLTELEAVHALNGVRRRPLPDGCDWAYGHPYAQTDVPLPCPGKSTEGGGWSLAHLIPWFDDDPKARFLDEIAYITDTDNGVKSPQLKRSKTSKGGAPPSASGAKDKAKQNDAEKERDKDDEGARARAQGEVEKVSVDEFWERMSFRQECSAGVVTGFFALGLHTPRPPASTSSGSQPQTQTQPGEVPPALVRRVVATLMNHHEFSTAERAARATETLEEAIRGLCEDLRSVRPPSSSAPLLASSSAAQNALGVGEDARAVAPEREFAEVLVEPPRTPPRRPRALAVPDSADDGSPGGSAIEEPVPSLETYHAYIFGTRAVDNPPAPAETPAQVAAGKPAVTVLAARKKRKAGA